MSLSLSFEGRISRADYWWAIAQIVFAAVVSVTPFVLLFSVFGGSVEQAKFVIFTIAFLLMLPLASTIIRRLHDIGFSAWFIWGICFLLMLFRVVDLLALVVIILGCVKGSEKENRYGRHNGFGSLGTTASRNSDPLFYAVGAMGIVSIFSVVYVLGSSMLPDANIKHLSLVVIDFSSFKNGQEALEAARAK